MVNQRLEQLMDRWMSDRDDGVTRTAEELCDDSPELVEELSRRIEIVKRFEQLAEVETTGSPASQCGIDTSHSANTQANTPMKRSSLPASIGNFRLLEILGEGGMGAVYLAEDSQLGRRVAVKVMKKELAADPDAKHRFLREARSMATIEHENIMTIYSVGEDQGTPYLVMPALKGETLDDRLFRESRLPVADALRIGLEIAAGLAAAHSHGLIHRDIKPSNIWLEGSQGRVRILDFGLARPASEDQKVTQSGAILGTPAYMAPEQAAGTEATLRSDLFSMGSVMYRMATGTQPFAGPNMMATLNNLANKQPDPPTMVCPDIPESLSALILRLIAKSPEQRPKSAADVVELLKKVEVQQSTESNIPIPTTLQSPLQQIDVTAGCRETNDPEKRTSSRHQPPNSLRKLMAGGMAGFLILMSFMIYRIQTDVGVLIVSIDDEQVAAKLTKGGLTIEDAKTGRTWTIKPDQPASVPSGEYRLPQPEGLLLQVTDDTGTEFTTAEFKIKRGDQITVQVKLERPLKPVVVNPDWKGWPSDAPAPAIAPFDAAQARRHQEEWAKHLGVPVEYTNSIGMKFVLIPPGEFLMGSTSEEVAKEVPFVKKTDARWMECLHTESPQHRVVLPEAMYVAVHEVTNRQFLTLSNETNTKPNPSKDDHPIVWVTHNAVEDFCRLLSKQEKLESVSVGTADGAPTPPAQSAEQGYRLLTEAEWEFACRAGTSTRFWSGADEASLVEAAWFAENSSNTTHPVGSRKPNAFGIHDMLGNAWEWCADEWSPAYYAELAAGTAIRPAGPLLNKSIYVARGGDWHDVAAACRSAFRYGYPVSFRSSGMGFRIAVPWRTVHDLTTRNVKDPLTGSSATDIANKTAEASPLTVLDGKQIPLEERIPELPPETVAVLGSSHGKTWGSPIYTTHGNMTYSPDGKWIIECDSSNVYLFDANTLMLKRRFPFVQHFWTHRSASFSSDSRTLFLATQVNAAGSGNSVTDLMSPELNTTHHSVGFGYSYVIANSRDDSWVAMNSLNENEVWVGHRDRTTHTLKDMRPIPDAPGLPNSSAIGRVLDLAFSPDGQWLISGHFIGTSGGYRVSRKQDEDFVSVAFIPVQINQHSVRIAYSFMGGRKVALLTAGDVCHQVDLSLPSDLPVPEAGLPVIRAEALIGVHDVTVSADGQTWAASKNTFGKPPVALVGTWQDGVPVVRHTIPLDGHSVGHVAMSPDGKSLAVTNDNRSIVLYDLTGEPSVAGINSELYSTAVSTNSDVYVTISTAGKVQLSRLGSDGDEVLDSSNSPETRMGFHNACISSDGKRVIAFSAPDGFRENRSRLQVWEILNHQLVEGPSLDVAVENAYSETLMFHSGKRMMYGNQIRDVSTAPATIVTTFSKMSSRQPACAVSDDDQLVALMGDGNRLAVFRPDQSAEEPVASVQLPIPPTSMAFSPDGRRIITTHDGPVCIVWELNGNQISEVARMPSFTYEGFSGMYHTTTSAFSGDGKSVFVGAWGEVVEWKLDDHSLGRHWSIPGFTRLSRTSDSHHLIFNNSNTTTWILRLTKP